MKETEEKVSATHLHSSDTKEGGVAVGRFAPSPSGRMHMGNLLAAYASYKSVKEKGGRWILRIEDLDPDRSKEEYSKWIEDDLNWLGLDWDEGGLEGRGTHGPYSQSKRTGIYQNVLETLIDKGLVYECHCTRADIRAAGAPHQSDGEFRYPGTCRPHTPINVRQSDNPELNIKHSGASLRLIVPDRDICFTDKIYGPQKINIYQTCGDFVIKRSDGVFAYQLAVTVDDALMGVTEVVRGEDLLGSAARQIYIHKLMGWRPPEYMHIPLLRNTRGERLSKRDHSLSMDELRKQFTPTQLRQQLEDILTQSIKDHRSNN